MTESVWWYVLAGFLLGFILSTLWEWLYFRRRRLRIENRRIAELEATVRSLAVAGSTGGAAPGVAPGYQGPGVFLENEGLQAGAETVATAYTPFAVYAATTTEQPAEASQPTTFVAAERSVAAPNEQIIPPEPVQPKSSQAEPVRAEPVQPRPVRSEPVQSDSIRSEFVQSESVQSESVQVEPPAQPPPIVPVITQPSQPIQSPQPAPAAQQPAPAPAPPSVPPAAPNQPAQQPQPQPATAQAPPITPATPQATGERLNGFVYVIQEPEESDAVLEEPAAVVEATAAAAEDTTVVVQDAADVATAQEAAPAQAPSTSASTPPALSSFLPSAPKFASAASNGNHVQPANSPATAMPMNDIQPGIQRVSGELDNLLVSLQGLIATTDPLLENTTGADTEAKSAAPEPAVTGPYAARNLSRGEYAVVRFMQSARQLGRDLRSLYWGQ